MGMMIKGGAGNILAGSDTGLCRRSVLKKKQTMSIGEMFLAGYLALFFHYGASYAPMTWLKAPLHVLTISFGLAGAALAVWGAFCLAKQKKLSPLPKIKIHFNFYFLSGNPAYNSSGGNVHGPCAHGCRRLFLCGSGDHRRIYRYHLRDKSIYPDVSISAFQKIYPFSVPCVPGSGQPACERTASGDHGAYVLSSCISPGRIPGTVHAGQEMVRRRQPCKVDLSFPCSASRGIFRLLGLQCGEFPDGSYLAGKSASCGGYAAPSFSICASRSFLKKKPEYPWYFLLLANISCCPFILHGNHSGAFDDRVFHGDMPDKDRRMETGRLWAAQAAFRRCFWELRISVFDGG